MVNRLERVFKCMVNQLVENDDIEFLTDRIPDKIKEETLSDYIECESEIVESDDE